MQKHNLNEVDKNGFPINDKGEQVPLFDSEGNAVLLLNSNQIVNFSKVYVIKFNPKDKLAVRKGLDTLVNKLTNKFDEHLKGEFTLDFTKEAKTKYNIFTKEPLIYPIVQMYFSWINGWLNYLGNCYNIEFKVLFYTKYKEKIKNNFIALKTGLNKHDINKKYLEFAEIWLKETDRNIELEEKIKSKTIPKSKNEKENIEPIKQKHEIVLNKLNEYKFNELETVKNLDLDNLSKHIFCKDLPYQIAYLDFLGFIIELKKSYCTTNVNLHKRLAKILDTNERAIRGNINVLKSYSKEDENKYTSHLHRESVKEHYGTLK